ncbi:4Fe-4S dicluster domain-containing protein [Faecalicatena acetigenes]|uniref:4Fe-4S dicluster domain-containing protein n=1 Tax=Faecalicatena acetigenes TaxID=2981790 RepID=A0ABT2T9P5_9FIRM|nr:MULTISPECIES: [Fe-Fe] hydrogenase large subunit C-terminal domain-containing protein [Lachnospiraceae]MCU6746561.1 4Fe-4S dicluster domain-containing protein [Faecalicatena acetigenes]SCH24709.1 Periplasmic [Fe] hydrogenase large subunit [uncultured Clostridium sp.]
MDKFIRSVRLDEAACQGCINCIKYCPTQAIRVHNGKAHIIDKFCIDCGRCIRYCPHHAKIPAYDPLTVINDFKYTVALPAPSLYAQYNNLSNVDIVLNALIRLGFDDVYEVSAAAELVSEISREYIQAHEEDAPFISSACPSVVRLIRVKFPSLIPRLLPIKPPVEIAAEIARKRAMKKTGLPSKEIGIIFISPCPSKVSYAKAPLGIDKSNIDKVVAIKDVYPLLLPLMSRDESQLRPLSASGRIGIGWGNSGGEIGGLLTDNYLAADGIVNILRVLEAMEDEKIHGLKFAELNACSGGCVGGTLTVENAYVATAKTKRLLKYQPVSRSHLATTPEAGNLYWDDNVEYEPVFRLGNTFKESLEMMSTVEALTQKFPGLDCGSCGAPTCQTLAEDIVRGAATSNDCIYVLREHISSLSKEIEHLSKSINLSGNCQDENTQLLCDYIQKLTAELSEFGVPKKEE